MDGAGGASAGACRVEGPLPGRVGKAKEREDKGGRSGKEAITGIILPACEVQMCTRVLLLFLLLLPPRPIMTVMRLITMILFSSNKLQE